MKRSLLFLTFALLLAAQDVLTNDSIVKMSKAGLGEGVIVSMIQSQPGKYSLTADELVKLKQAGISDKVMAAMVAKSSAPAQAPAAAPMSAAGPADGADLPKDLDVGVYYKKGGRWEEMLPEVVTWKTGGVLKSMASGGIVKGDINGHIQGGNSRNSLTTPVEVVIDAAEGVSITEYQLLKLHDKPDSREFRTMTGGIVHASGGASRDVVPFEGKKVMSRVFRVSIPSLGPGEYGFLPPGAAGSASSASVGKMYTFRLIE